MENTWTWDTLESPLVKEYKLEHHGLHVFAWGLQKIRLQPAETSGDWNILTGRVTNLEMFLWDTRFEVIFWLLTPCSDTAGYRRFGGPCCLHLQGETSGTWNRYEIGTESYAYNNKHSLRSNTKGYGGKIN